MTTKGKRRELSRADLLSKGREIAEQYQRAGHSLTLRQLYYQLVATGVSPNSQDDYERLSEVLSDARLEGDFDPDLIIDRGRSAKPTDATDRKFDVDSGEGEAAKWLRSLPFAGWRARVDVQRERLRDRIRAPFWAREALDGQK